MTRMAPSQLLRSMEVVSCRVTPSALVDAREIVLALFEENTAAIKEATPKERERLIEDRATMTRMLVILNHRISVAERVQNFISHLFKPSLARPR